jgi:2'-5' RNA ligase
VTGRRDCPVAAESSDDALVVGVAIEVPDPFGAELRAWRARFGDPRAAWVPAHITLVPPTAVTGVVLIDLEAHLVAALAGSRPFDVRLAGTGSFRPVSPVTFVRVESGGEACEDLQRRVRQGPLDRELAYAYHPHVTVAQELPDHVLDEAAAVLDGWSCGFTVDHVTLYRHHDDGGWRPVSEVKLPRA